MIFSKKNQIFFYVKIVTLKRLTKEITIDTLRPRNTLSMKINIFLQILPKKTQGCVSVENHTKTTQVCGDIKTKAPV
jgi:hypothetical protein